MLDIFQYQVYTRNIIRLNPTRDTHPIDFLDNIPDLVAEIPAPRLKNLRALGGHFLYGIHKLLPMDSEYITMLRDPVQRVASEYYYMKDYGFFHQKEIIEHNLTLEDYLDHEDTAYLNNLQTRLLSGFPYSQKPFVDEEMLETAMRNAENCLAVGIAEEFVNSLALFCHKLSWKKIPYVTRKNVNTHRTSMTLEENESVRISEREKYDIRLYHHCRELFHKQLLNDDHEIGIIRKQIEDPPLTSLYSRKVVSAMDRIFTKVVRKFTGRRGRSW